MKIKPKASLLPISIGWNQDFVLKLIMPFDQASGFAIMMRLKTHIRTPKKAIKYMYWPPVFRFRSQRLTVLIGDPLPTDFCNVDGSDLPVIFKIAIRCLMEIIYPGLLHHQRYRRVDV